MTSVFPLDEVFPAEAHMCPDCGDFCDCGETAPWFCEHDCEEA